MNRPAKVTTGLVSILLGMGLTGTPATAAPVASSVATPAAACGADDPVETGLQGQVPLADRLSGRSAAGYRCNTELVSSVPGEGGFIQGAFAGTCGYFGTANNSRQTSPGTVVVDGVATRQAKIVGHLDARSMLDVWESLKTNESRHLLAALEKAGPGFAVYDVSRCATPRLLAEIDLPDQLGHAGNFAPDGRTYYAGNDNFTGFIAVDVSNPRAPRPVARWTGEPGFPAQLHDLSLSADGTRAYVGYFGTNIVGVDASQSQGLTPTDNGMTILDVSDIQARKPDPKIRVLGSVTWEDGSTAQTAQIMTINGRKYVAASDELGSRGVGSNVSWVSACAQGLPPYGYTRLIDVTDENKPVIVSRLMTEAQEVANCALVVNDTTGGLFGYDAHYCAPDDPADTRLVACSQWQSGLRVYDVSDPARPREVAYYNPPARPGRAQPGSAGSTGTGVGGTADQTSSDIRFFPERNQIGFMSQANGLQVVALTHGVTMSGAAAPVAAAAPARPAAPAAARTRRQLLRRDPAQDRSISRRRGRGPRFLRSLCWRSVLRCSFGAAEPEGDVSACSADPVAPARPCAPALELRDRGRAPCPARRRRRSDRRAREPHLRQRADGSLLVGTHADADHRPRSGRRRRPGRRAVPAYRAATAGRAVRAGVGLPGLGGTRPGRRRRRGSFPARCPLRPPPPAGRGGRGHQRGSRRVRAPARPAVRVARAAAGPAGRRPARHAPRFDRHLDSSRRRPRARRLGRLVPPLTRSLGQAARMDRRAFLTASATAAAVGMLPVRALAQAKPDPGLAPFLHGVASGDPLSDSVVLWTRVTGSGSADLPVGWVVARDVALTDVVRRGTTTAVGARDRTVKVDVDGLPAGTTLWYAFVALGRRSMVGRTRTAPAVDSAVDRLRYAVVTCAKYDVGYFNGYARVAEADVDAVLHLGDYLYEGATAGDALAGRDPDPTTEIRSLAEYRRRHAQYKTDPDLQRVHQSHPMVATWDDHESSNDSWRDGAGSHDPAVDGSWPVRKAAAQRAYDEWMPVRLPVPGDPTRLYRSLAAGSLADLLVLDTRLEGRSQQLEGLDSDQIILDPAVADPARQMYSPVQRAFVERELAGSTAAWRIVLNQVLISQFRAVGFPADVSAALQSLGQNGLPSQGVALAADIWDGYSAERDRLLGFLRNEPVHDVVVLTGDIHASLANDLTEDPYDPLRPSTAVEMVTPSLTSTNFDEALGVPPRTTSLGIEAALRAQNPSTRYVELDSNGYVVLDITRARVQGEWYFVDTVLEPTAGQRLDATWQVLRGADRLSAGGPATSARPDRPAQAPAPVVTDLEASSSGPTTSPLADPSYPRPAWAGPHRRASRCSRPPCSRAVGASTTAWSSPIWT